MYIAHRTDHDLDNLVDPIINTSYQKLPFGSGDDPDASRRSYP